jgi:putative DNA primase/helicase
VPEASSDNELALTSEQVAELTKGSAISPDVVQRARLYSLDDARAAAKLLGRAPKYWDGHLPVIVYPYHLPFHRDPVRYRGKPGKPFESTREDGSVSLQKYVEAKGSPVHLYFGPSLLEGRALKDATTPLWITEGEKKCLSAESHGLACLAVSGVNQWHEKGQKTLHPDFAHVALEGREILIAFDRDALTNRLVRDQELALGRALMGAGARVFIVRFPEDAPKLDDFLARHELSEVGALVADAKKHGEVAKETRVSGAPAPATELTDLANAERLARQHGEELRYCEQTSTWYAWTGKRWERDHTQIVVRRAMATVRSIYAEADAVGDEDARNAMRAHARRSEGQGRIVAIVKLAGALRSLAVSLERFDADPWLLNCENGTVDLRSGQLLEHQRGRFITKLAPVHFDPEARHERWDKFLEHVTDGSAEVADFLARAVGYSLTGDTREDKLFFIFGPPGRGKSTFVGAIEAALGEYARSADMSTFMASPHQGGGDRPRPDLVRLAGARICVCKEIDAGAKLAEGLVKTITGGDVITVRDLHSKPLELRPTFKLWLVANDPPTIRSDDAGMWRRMVRVPFTRPVDNPEQGFRDALSSEPELRTAVLAWAVRGVRAWLEGGLRIPLSVIESTADYRAEMDPAGEFFERHCVFEEDARCARKELRKAYEEWCKDDGHQPLGARRFSAALRERARELGFDETSVEVNIRVDHRFVDGWRYVRLVTDLERSMERAERAWGRRPKVHEEPAVGTVGVVGSFKVFPTCAGATINGPPASGIYPSPHSPHGPHRPDNEQSDHRSNCGDFSGDCGEKEEKEEENKPNGGGEGHKWLL